MKKIILILMLTLFSLSYSSENNGSYNYTKQYNTENIKEIYLETDNGTIKVVPTDSKEVTFSIKSNKEKEINASVDNSSINLKVKSPSGFFDFLTKLNVNKKSSQVSIVVQLPKSYINKTYFYSINGLIDISNVNSIIEARSVNGEIKIDSVPRVSLVKATNGRINVSNIKDLGSLKTVNGGISAININSINSAKATNGKIEVSTDLFSKNGYIKSVNGSLNLSIKKFAGKNSISTTNGSIDIHVSKGEINIDTTSYSSNNRIEDSDKDIVIKGRKIKIETL